MSKRSNVKQKSNRVLEKNEDSAAGKKWKQSKRATNRFSAEGKRRCTITYA